MMNCSIASNSNLVGIGLFGCGILIQQFILNKNIELNKKNNYELVFEKTHSDVLNYSDNIKHYYSPDESEEFYKSNFKLSDEYKINIEHEDTQNKINEEINKNETLNSVKLEQQIIKNNIIDFKEKNKNEDNVNQILNRILTKTKSEIEFESTNPTQVIIKLIYNDDNNDDDYFCWKIERRIIDSVSSISGKDLNIIIQTEGGPVRYVVSICNALYIYKKINSANKIKIYVPKFAYNTGTYVALMADELYLNDYALLSPVDIQLNLTIENFSSNDYIKYSEDDDRKTTDIFKNSLMMSIVSKKYMNLSTFIFNKFIFNNCNKYNPKIRKQITNKFIHTEYPHFITFDKDEIINSGIEIKGNVPKEIMDIYKEAIEK